MIKMQQKGHASYYSAALKSYDTVRCIIMSSVSTVQVVWIEHYLLHIKSTSSIRRILSTFHNADDLDD